MKQVYTGDPNDGPFPEFEGRGYWGYNTVSKRYEGFWIDNGSTLMQNESGDVDERGRVWTMKGQMPNPQSRGTMTKRSVITLEDEDHYSVEMFLDSGEGEAKVMEIKYTRS